MLQIFREVKALLSSPDADSDSDGEMEVEYALQEVMMDFEAAAWRAFRSVFPGINIKGCAFHWNQAIWRKVCVSYFILI